MHRWKLEHEDILDQVATYEGGCISMDNADKKHPVTSQPCAEEVKKIKCMLREWEDEVRGDEDPVKESEHLRTIVEALNTLKGRAYGGQRGKRSTDRQNAGRNNGNSGCA